MTPWPFVHKVHSDEASVEINPAGQSLHSVTWPPKPNLPTGQFAHSEIIVAKYSPLAQRGLSVWSQELLPIPSMFVWKPAPVQVLQVVWPCWSWYVFTVHQSQTVPPTLLLLPNGQSLHTKGLRRLTSLPAGHGAQKSKVADGPWPEKHSVQEFDVKPLTHPSGQVSHSKFESPTLKKPRGQSVQEGWLSWFW